MVEYTNLIEYTNVTFEEEKTYQKEDTGYEANRCSGNYNSAEQWPRFKARARLSYAVVESKTKKKQNRKLVKK